MGAIEVIMTIASALVISAITSCAALLWKMGNNVTLLTSSLKGIESRFDGIDKRFDDHSKFIEMILERVLPNRKE